DNPITTAAMTVSRRSDRLKQVRDQKARKEEFIWKGLNQADEDGPAVTLEEPIAVDKKARERSGRRPDISMQEAKKKKSQMVREIESKLELPVNLSFNDTPLQKVIDDLR